MYHIERFNEEQGRAALRQFVALLRDAVDDGASVGFLPPLEDKAAEDFWLEMFGEVGGGTRILLVAREAEELAGTVQLDLARKQTAQHRAEVQKLLVHTRFRGRGLGKALMSAIEEAAREAGRTLLYLDTIEGCAAEHLYVKCGYERAGVIPQFALSGVGVLEPTVIFYRLL